jgi:putative ABC transport system permease protein
LIFASIWRAKGLYALWILSLCAAVSGLVIIDVYRASLAGTLSDQGVKILSAHVEVSGRRLFTEQEFNDLTAALPPGYELSRMVEMYAMVSAAKDSRLATLRFVDDMYPLVGSLNIGGEDRHGNALAEAPVIWLAPDFIPLMNVSEGSTIQIGSAKFTVRGFIGKDSSQTYRIGSLAPKIYIHKKYLPATGLMQFGSTFSDSIYAKVPEPVPRDFKAKINKALPDPAIRITVPADLEQGSLRVMSRLLDYLGLVGLVTLSLGWIGVYYLGRRWLMLESASGGLLKCLGLSTKEIQRMWLIKLSMILIVGVLAGGLAAWIGSNTVVPLFRAGLPDDFKLIWSWRNTLLLLLIGPGMGWMLLADSVIRTARAPALRLVAGESILGRSLRMWLALIIGLILLAIALTFLQARSWLVSFTFLGALVASVLIVAGLAFASLALVRACRSGRLGWLWHTASAMWIRRPTVAVLMVTVTAMCGLLSQLIPHLEMTIVGELRSVPGSARPGLFLFDIQDEQMAPIDAKLKAAGLEVSQRSPLVRARLIQVNGVDYERSEVDSWSTREEEGNARMRNRGVNLSFRETLGPAEKVIEGKKFEQLSVEPTELSVEEGYADRMKLKIGDDLLFDVQGVDVRAKVANLRQVNWDSFQPNFFIQMRPGVIDGAPKTWIVTLNRHPTLKPHDIQRLLAKDFPNVTSINIEEAVDTLTTLLTQLGSGLRIASRLSLALGLFVFVMILMFQLLSSERDWIQLHRQGLRGRDILKLQLATFGTLSAWGAILGSALSLLVCWSLATWTFQIRAQYDWSSSVQVLALTCLLSVSALFVLSLRQFKRTRSKSRFDSL